MKQSVALAALMLLGFALFSTATATRASGDEAEIRKLVDRWSNTFRARDLKGIMSIYAPGSEWVAFDVVLLLE